MGLKTPINNFFDDYHQYKEASLTKRRFKHKDILSLVHKLESIKGFRVELQGRSLEEREIFLISIGEGKTKILCWSQMHGDEATATMALFDLINFFSSDDKYNDFRSQLLKEVTLYFIPMLNPDGAERFQRENAIGIDLNRDALNLASPEANILMSVGNKLSPQFGFNLHDQNSYYRVGYSGKAAAISFAAPPFDYKKTMSKTREDSMKIIVGLYTEMQKYIPGHLARYSDEFEPRSFGDNFTRMGTSSILIESGGWHDDNEKQFLRQINFVALLTGFTTIATGNYVRNNEAEYFSIPENKELMFDYLIKNVNLPFNGQNYKVDIGIKHKEISATDSEDYYRIGTIEEIGDLSTYRSNNEIDCSGLNIFKGKTYSTTFNSYSDIKELDFEKLYQQNYLSVVLKDNTVKNNFTKLPVNILLNDCQLDYSLSLQNKANFVIKEGEATKLVVLNGFVFEPALSKMPLLNGLIIG